MKDLQSNLWEILKFVITILVIVLPIRYFIAQPFIVSGASMSPTFQHNEYLIVDELSYHLRSPARGEVVIFKYPRDPKKYFIKRIIGLPGETVRVKDNEVSITANGQTTILQEPYLTGGFWADVERTLGDQEYFVMGDNRLVSLDSRSWGALPSENIKGRAFLRLFPLDRINLFPGAADATLAN